MSITSELYLLWSPQGWGVFSEGTCPDPHGLPQYWFKKYEIPFDNDKTIFDRLVNIKDQLVREGIVPDEENYSRIFPDISDILNE